MSGAAVIVPKVGEIWTYGKDQTAEIVAVKDGYVFYFCRKHGVASPSSAALGSFRAYKPPQVIPDQVFVNVYEKGHLGGGFRTAKEATSCATHDALEIAVRYIREDLT